MTGSVAERHDARMKVNMPRTIIALALAAAGISGITAAPADTPHICYPDWSEAAPIVARERLRSARDIQATTRREIGGDVVSITLCREPSGYVYRVLFRNPQGRFSSLKVGARDDGPY